jgi:hypothetical protein
LGTRECRSGHGADAAASAPTHGVDELHAIAGKVFLRRLCEIHVEVVGIVLDPDESVITVAAGPPHT